jgi:hypothetical protein
MMSMRNSNLVERFQFPHETQDGTGNVSLQPTRVTSQKVYLCSNARKWAENVTAAFLRLGFQPKTKPPPLCDYLRRRRSSDSQLTADKTKLNRQK